MRVLSLFDGISCARLALNRANIPIEVFFASEIDKYAIGITQYNFPNTIQIGDIREIDFTKYIGKIDLIMGGSPCIDLSICGKREGLKGKRSSLFYNFVEAVKIINPKYYLLENNVGMPREAYEEISKFMGCYPIVINSSRFSAQNRKRYYWFNWGNKDYSTPLPTCNIPLPDYKNVFVQDILEGEVVKGVIDTDVIGPIRMKEYDLSKGQAQRVYSITGKSVSLTANGGGQGAKTGLYKVDSPDGSYVIRKLEPIECERLQTLPDNYTSKGIIDGKEVKISNTQRYKCIGNAWTVDVIKYILGKM